MEVGGGIRTYMVDDHYLLDGYDAAERCTGGRGLPLIPWANRLEDGATPSSSGAAVIRTRRRPQHVDAVRLAEEH